jgi:hypothetical protein
VTLGRVVSSPTGGLYPDDVLAAAPVAVQDDHPQRRLEPRFCLFQQPFFEPARLRLFVLEDHDLVRGLLQQRVLRGLDRVGIAHLAAGLDAILTQLSEHSLEPSLGFLSGLVDVAERVTQRVRLYRRHHHAQVYLPAAVAGFLGLDHAQGLRPERIAGDNRQQPVRRRLRHYSSSGMASSASP